MVNFKSMDISKTGKDGKVSNTANSSNKLISPLFLRKLEKLQLLSKKIIRGSIKGERASAKRGRSVEFADYREYVPGDELRIIDWNIYGRLDKLFIKLFVEEEELILYILIDRSLSMSFGTPQKIEYARQVAASIGYIALANFDRVAVGVMDEKLAHLQGPVRGKNQVFNLFKILEDIKPSGRTSLSQAVKQFTTRKLRPGLVIVLSDFFDKEDYFRQLKNIVYQKNELYLVQILDPFELNPDFGGDMKLEDMETGEFREVTVTDKLLDMYRETVKAYCGQIEDFARSLGAGYIPAPTSIPFEDLVMEYLRLGRLLK